jgi:fructosamine-3-kinase
MEIYGYPRLSKLLCFTNWYLQSGNVGVDKKTGRPVIYDPASYFGHNEAECAHLSSFPNGTLT